jgi:stage II sporulation protein D
LAIALLAPLFAWMVGGAEPQRAASQSGFPQTVRARLWYFQQPGTVKLKAEPGQAKLRKCATCAETPLSAVTIRASGSQVQIESEKVTTPEVRVSGVYEAAAANVPPLRGDFPLIIRASDGKLQVTATMPMEEYIAGVLAGETGNFQSDEAQKAMAVAARTYALHFGARHSLEGFDFCDSTHCQALRLDAVTPRLRKVSESTASEVLWYNGEPAAAYYHANCGGTTEDGRYFLGNNMLHPPYLKQHSDTYCVRGGNSHWRGEVSMQELRRALMAEGVKIPGQIRSVTVAQRTPSGRVEFLTVIGSRSVTVPGLAFRLAVGRNIGWERLKSNWYDVRPDGQRLVFQGRGSGHGVGLCQVGAEIMGEEGKTYAEILSFYYPGTRLGVSAQGTQWQQLSSEDVELFATRPERDRTLLPLAARIMHEAEENTGLLYNSHVKLRVYASVAEFRDATGEPGWVAASARGSTIRLQPTDVLRDSATLESTLKHELLHILVESHAKAGTPLWFREGLVLYLAQPQAVPKNVGGFPSSDALNSVLRKPGNEAQMREAYAEAQYRVSKMVARNGKNTVIRWLQEGIPGNSLL